MKLLYYRDFPFTTGLRRRATINKRADIKIWSSEVKRA